MRDNSGSAGSLWMVPLNKVPIRRVPMTDMGVGCDRRELNDDQKDRRSDHPKKCAGRSHAQVLLYDPGQVNNG
ncbi:MAG: hypothetical protein JWR80_823 [Bradyrhizobium sp.]|nr:hypothetical protein [Bradyrhizobium sp.]